MSEYRKMLRNHIGHAPILLCGASVIVYRDNEILLQLRTDNHCWGYLGGSVEPGEVVENAAMREMFEESGLSAHSLTLFNVYSGEDLHHVYPNGDEVHIIDIVFGCSDFSGEMIQQTDETDDLRWFSSDSLPENISPPVKRPLTDFANWLRERNTKI